MLNVIINNEEHLQICKKYEIEFMSKEEFLGMYNNEDSDDYIKNNQANINITMNKYEQQRSPFKILWH